MLPDLYPDDEQFLRLAEALHVATKDLPGPVILSDRPLRAGSLVHYRYFTGTTRRDNEGMLEAMLQVSSSTVRQTTPSRSTRQDSCGGGYWMPADARERTSPASSATTPKVPHPRTASHTPLLDEHQDVFGEAEQAGGPAAPGARAA
ncbi:class III lanthionine synthetase LanKC N-terminal domain-containing protein [Streptomyces sp. NPDC001340]